MGRRRHGARRRPDRAARSGRHHVGRIEIESLDITRPDEIASLHDHLAGRRFDVLFVNAGIANSNPQDALGQVETDEFVRVMVTNALSPMRVIEGLHDLVSPAGTIGVMSSGQGSIAGNERGGNDVYRAAKAALNMAMRCYAARQRASERALVLLAPGWIRTALGGPNATFTVEDSMPKVVDVLALAAGQAGSVLPRSRGADSALVSGGLRHAGAPTRALRRVARPPVVRLCRPPG